MNLDQFWQGFAVGFDQIVRAAIEIGDCSLLGIDSQMMKQGRIDIAIRNGL